MKIIGREGSSGGNLRWSLKINNALKDTCTVLFFKIKFSASYEESSLRRCEFQISVEMVKPFARTKQFCKAFACIVLCKLNYGTRGLWLPTRHFFIKYLPNGTVFSCKICHRLHV